MAIRLVASGGVIFRRLGVKAHTTQFQIYTAANITRGLRIAVKARIQADALQIAALHIRRHRVHLVGAGIENLHAVDGGRHAFGGHVVDYRLPGIVAPSHHLYLRQLSQMLVNTGRASFADGILTRAHSSGNDHLIDGRLLDCCVLQA